MTTTCPDCIYYNAADSTCRHNSPSPAMEVSGQYSLTWPPVSSTDWCAEGWNPTDGSYDMRPSAAQVPIDVTGRKV